MKAAKGFRLSVFLCDKPEALRTKHGEAQRALIEARLPSAPPRSGTWGARGQPGARRAGCGHRSCAGLSPPGCSVLCCRSISAPSGEGCVKATDRCDFGLPLTAATVVSWSCKAGGRALLVVRIVPLSAAETSRQKAWEQGEQGWSLYLKSRWSSNSFL